MVDNHTLPIYICEDIPERLMQLKEIAETQINTEDLPFYSIVSSILFATIVLSAALK